MQTFHPKAINPENPLAGAIADECRRPADAVKRYYQTLNLARGMNDTRVDPPEEFKEGNILSAQASISEWVVLTGVLASARQVGLKVNVAARVKEAFDLWRHCPSWDGVPRNTGRLLFRQVLRYKCGVGNIIEQVHELLGLKATSPPCGSLVAPCSMRPKTVLLHLAIGKWGHVAQPVVTDQTLATLKQWTRSRKDLRFIEVGSKPLMGKEDNVAHCWCERMDDLLACAAECEYFVGVPAGVMYLAASFRRKIVALVQSIHPQDIALPRKKIYTHPKLGWLLPQAVHLSEIAESRLVKSVTTDALNDAIAGKCYPFWD